MKMKIGVDIDSVVCELMPTVLERINKKVGKTYTIEDVTNWDMSLDGEDLYKNIVEVLDDEETVSGLPTVEGAKKSIEILSRHGVEICFITSRHESRKENTKKWVEKNFGDYPVHHAGSGKDKNGFKIDMLVDDAPHHVKDFVDGGGHAILFDRPWNRDLGIYEHNLKLIRATKWKEVLSWVRLYGVVYGMGKIWWDEDEREI